MHLMTINFIYQFFVNIDMNHTSTTTTTSTPQTSLTDVKITQNTTLSNNNNNVTNTTGTNTTVSPTITINNNNKTTGATTPTAAPNLVSKHPTLFSLSKVVKNDSEPNSGKNPRVGDNNITPPTPTTTKTSTTETNLYVSTDNTKRPTTRVDTTLEVDSQSSTMATTVADQSTVNTTTIRTTNSTNNRTTILKVLKSCSTSNDCASNELCMDKRCLIKCDPKNNETNVNCAKGI